MDQMDSLALVDGSYSRTRKAPTHDLEVRPRSFDGVLCFGDSDWWYHNRGHADMQFMRRFAARCKVVYVNSLGVKTPGISEGRMFARRVLRKCKSISRYYRDGGEGFAVLSPLFVPFSGIKGRVMMKSLILQIKAIMRVAGMRNPLVWVACPTAAGALDRIPSAGMVYQLSDCYAALNSGNCEGTQTLEAALARRADLVLCSSRELQRRALELYGRGEYIDHGVDFDLFDRAAALPVPTELAAANRPIIGFFGNIDGNTVDRTLLDKVIPLRPAYTFVLVGPMAGDFEILRRHSNLVCIPQKPYQQIAQYGAAFDVCIMPWLDNEWIKHCNPIKLKEYLALGKPVVSTPFPELSSTGGLCYEATGPTDFCAALDRALAEDSAELSRRRKNWASSHTWDAKFEIVLGQLKDRGLRLEN